MTSRVRPPDPTRYIPFFRYRHGRLHAEGVALDRVAASVGTPVYVYSWAAIESAWKRFDRAFASAPHMVCYSVKANSNLSILRLLARLGSGFDIVSAGELDRLRRAGHYPISSHTKFSLFRIQGFAHPSRRCRKKSLEITS